MLLLEEPDELDLEDGPVDDDSDEDLSWSE
jgi:hypothetical protein